MDYNSVENARLAYAKKLKILIALYTIAVITVIVLTFLIGDFTGIVFALSMIIFVIPLSYYYFGNSFYKDERVYFKALYKSYFVEQNMRKVFTDLSYNHDSVIHNTTLHDILDATGMVRTGDIISTNDYATGKYHDVNFIQADTTISEDDSDGGYFPVFTGRWMIFDFPKKFSNKLEIVQEGFRAYKVPSFDLNKHTFEEYHVESPTFHNKFRIYSDDGVETYRILTPDLIYRIEFLSDNCKGKLFLCFANNRLIVGLDSYIDSLEPPSPFKKLDELDESIRVNNDLKIIIDFVDYLELDKNIFTN